MHNPMTVTLHCAFHAAVPVFFFLRYMIVNFKWNFMKACCTSMWSYFPQYIYSIGKQSYLK